jgi:putative nucleotidyltransferase with HDIG domain
MEKRGPSPYKLLNKLRSESWKTNAGIRLTLYAIFGIAFYLLLLGHVLPEQYVVRVGTVSPTTIVSPVTKIDHAATQAAAEEAAQKVEPEYTIDQVLTTRTVTRIDQLFAKVRQIVEDPTLDEQGKIRLLKEATRETMGNTFPEEFYRTLARTPLDRLGRIRTQTQEIVYDIMKTGIKKSELDEKRESVDRHLVQSLLDQDALDPASRSIVRELAKKSLVANEYYDGQKTEKKREAAREAVEPVLIKKGQIIVAEGELVTEEIKGKLENLGLVRSKSLIQVYGGLALFVFLLLVMLHFYIKWFEPAVDGDNSKLLLLFSAMLLALIGMKLLAMGQNPEWSMIGYLAPVGLGAMLTALLLRVSLALACSVILAIAASVFFQGDNHLFFDFRYGFVSLVSGTAGAFALTDVRKRSRILQAGVLAAIASAVAILSLYMIVPSGENWVDWLIPPLFGMGGGFLSAVLTMGFLPYFEVAFGILSPLRLLELGNPNHPLLRRLLIEAPGTYHHSIIVANMAEAAAEAVGADGLLARVGAYYHDVGKLKRPQFFIENQMHCNNPHDRISPNLSKSIIISHAKDGAEMLREYGIPAPLQDIAAQHHGTTLLKYFYHKAQSQQKDGETVREEDFRYPGPKARFKEAAIVGICDCVEAAVRSMARPTPGRIENLVKKIIRERLEDGQFDECDLTLKELDLIARSVCETLQGLFHKRIEYPEENRQKERTNDEATLAGTQRGS